MNYSFRSAVVGTTNPGPASSVSATITGVVQGDYLYLGLGAFRPSALTLTPTDTAGNAWVPINDTSEANDGAFAWQCTANASGSLTVTISATLSGNPATDYMAMIVADFAASGQPLTITGTSAASSSGSTTTPAPGSIPISGQACLVIGFACTATNGNTWTASPGYTLAASYGGQNNKANAVALEYQIGVTSNANPGFTLASAGTWDALGVAILDHYVESITPSIAAIPTNHASLITIDLTGTNLITPWVPASTNTFTFPGVPAGTTIVSQVVNTASTATIVVTTGATAGTLAISDGATTADVTIAAATLAVSPATVNASASATVDLTGTGTVWTQESISPLFITSGVAGVSLSAIHVTSNTTATATLTAGATTGTATIADASTGATAGVSVAQFPPFGTPYSITPVASHLAASVSINFGSLVSPGDIVVVPVSIYRPGTTTFTCSDNYNAGNWKLIGSSLQSGSINSGVFAWSSVPAITGPNFTVTITPSSGTFFFTASGIGATPAFVPVADGLGTAHGTTGTALLSGSFTTQGTNDLIVMIATTTVNGQTWSVGPGLTVAQSYTGVNNQGVSLLVAYESLTNSAGVYDLSAGVSSSTAWSAMGFAFANLFNESIQASPAAIAPGGSVLIAVTLTAAHQTVPWGSGTTFTASGLAGASIRSWTVASASTAIVQLVTGSAAGTVTISDGIAAANITVSPQPFAINAWVSSNGLIIFHFTNPTPASNGAYGYLALTGVTADPVVMLNGQPLAIGPRTWGSTGQTAAFVAYRPSVAIQAGDVLTYTLPNGAFTTALGTSLGDAGTITNQVGKPLEGPVGTWPGFMITPTMLLGCNYGSQPAASTRNIFPAKNLMKQAGYESPSILSWKYNGAAVPGGYDANGHPISWPAGGTIQTNLARCDTANGIDGAGLPDVVSSTPGVSSQPCYAVQYDDPTGDKTVTLSGAGTVTVSAPVTTTAGGVVTIKWTVNYVSNPANLDPGLFLSLTSKLGTWKVNGADPNLWAFRPGSIIDRSIPLATSELALARFTSTHGRVPACIRMMDATEGYAGIMSYVNASDLLTSTAATWFNQFSRPNAGDSWSVRYLNTNPAKGPAPAGDGTYGWVSTRTYGPQSGYFVGGPDSFGSYCPLSSTDNGAFTRPPQNNNQSWCVVELVSSQPHGLIHGDLLAVVGSAASIPLTQGQTANLTAATASGYLPWITGPNSIAMAFYCGGTAPASSNILTVDPTHPGPYATDWTVGQKFPANPSCVPYSYQAAFCADLGAAVIPWVNLPPTVSDDGCRGLAAQIAPELPTNAVVWVEFGNEWWNNAKPNPQEAGSMMLMASYYPTGTKLFGGYYTATSGTSLPNPQVAYALAAAHAMDVFAAALAALRPDVTVKRVLGARSKSTLTTTNLLQAVSTYGLSFDYLAPAAYLGIPNDPPFLAAFNRSSGNWPVSQLNDLVRYFVALDTASQAFLSAAAASIATYSPAMKIVAYEGGVALPMPSTLTAPPYPALLQDQMADPSFYQTMWCWCLTLQQGCVTVPGSGFYLANYYQAMGVQTTVSAGIWMLAAGLTQPPGLGLANQTDSVATGKSYYATNQAVGLQAFLDWIDVTSSSPNLGTLVRLDPFKTTAASIPAGWQP